MAASGFVVGAGAVGATVVDEGAGGVVAVAGGATGTNEPDGTAEGLAGTDMGALVLLNEPIGGGALETGAVTMGAGCGISDPGNGGAVEAVGGAAICPISGTTLRVGADGGDEKVSGLMPEMGELLAVSSLITMPICTTASRQSVPQAIADERSRSGVRVEEGGVTGC